MVVIKLATYTTRCPFTNKLIRPSNIICLFNKEQFDAFEKFVNKLLFILPQDIIDIIIEKTRYKRLIGRFGFVKYTHWTMQYVKRKRKILFLKPLYLENVNENENESENESEND